jgi:hypothetical protein
LSWSWRTLFCRETSSRSAAKSTEGLEPSAGRAAVVEADEAGVDVKLFWQIAGIAVDVANRKTQVGRRRILTPRVKKVEIRKAVG